MDGPFPTLIGDPLAAFSLRYAFEWAMLNFYTFTLVLVRMSGLMTIGPLFGQPVVPANVRVLIVISMSLLITPTLDAIGPTRGLVEMPSTVIGYGRVVLGEFALGFVLGLGVMIVLSGLQLAGQLVDQQSGIALGDVVSPGLDVSGSLSGQHLYLLGVVVFLVMAPADGAPMNGHLHIVSALVETFQTMPVGEATVSVSSIDLLRDLVHQSLVLAILVAAPLLAVMSLVALAMGFLGHTVPQINVLIVGFPIRAMVSLFILALSMSGAARHVIDAVPQTIDGILHSLTL